MLIGFNELQQLFPYLKTDYKAQVEYVSRMAVHAKGVYRKGLFLQRYTEEPSAREWREKNFSPVTHYIFQRGTSGLMRVLADSGVSVDVPLERGDVSAFMAEMPYGAMSFKEYMSNHVLLKMLEDPNAILVVLPFEFLGPKIEPPQDVSPVLAVVPSKSVLFYDGKNVVWHHSSEKVGSKEIAHYLTLTPFIFSLTSVRKDGQRTVYEHRLLWQSVEINAALTAVAGNVSILGGIYDSDGYWRSFFDAIIQTGDLALQKFSDFEFANALSGYPLIQAIGVLCHTCGGSGKVDDLEHPGRQRVCPDCNGLGMRTPRLGVSNVWLRPEKVISDTEIDNRPAVEYIQGANETLNSMYGFFEKQETRTKESLSLVMITQAQSGAAKQIDREEQYAFFAKIAANFYGRLWQNALNAVSVYLDPTAKPNITIAIPKAFVVETIDDLQKQLESAQARGNAVEVYQAARDYNNRRFSTDLVSLRVDSFLQWFDPLYIYTIDKKQDLDGNRQISRTAFNVSMFAPVALQRALTEPQFRSKFLEMSNMQIADAITADLQTLVAEYGDSGEIPDENRSQSLFDDEQAEPIQTSIEQSDE